MIKKTITYTGFDGKEYTEDFYFHLNEVELTRLEASIPGGLSGRIQLAMDTQNMGVSLEIFETIIQKAYGVKTPDGKGFMKKQEYLDAFMSTDAYNQLFMELAGGDEDKINEFISGLVPNNIAKQMAEQKKPVILEGKI